MATETRVVEIRRDVVLSIYEQMRKIREFEEHVRLVEAAKALIGKR